jgi:hypothetical protein
MNRVDQARRPAVPAPRTLAVAAAVLAVATSGTSTRRPPAALEAAARAATLRECPLVDTVPGRHGEWTVVEYELTRGKTDVPEYHDCQRLVNDDEQTFGPLAAVFAARDLDDTLTFQADRTRAGLRIGHAAVLVRSIDGNYAPLGISQGFSCLYVWRDPVRDADWHAKLVPVGDAHGRCRQPLVVTPEPDPPLQVVRTTVPGFTSDVSYPAVARWDWDAAAKHQYIGLKCGAGWCEVGQRGFTPSPSIADAVGGSARGVRVLAVKGWYDQQRLAVMRDGRMVPGPVSAAVIPVPDLGRYMSRAEFATWRTVAYVALSGDAPVYAGKFNLHAPSPTASLARPGAFSPRAAASAPAPNGLNEIRLCYGRKGDCFRGGVAPPACGATIDAAAWWALVASAQGGPPKAFCIKRTDHAGVTIPGTARWRWLWKDETIWERCLPGCCELGDQ